MCSQSFPSSFHFLLPDTVVHVDHGRSGRAGPYPEFGEIYYNILDMLGHARNTLQHSVRNSFPPPQDDQGGLRFYTTLHYLVL